MDVADTGVQGVRHPGEDSKVDESKDLVSEMANDGRRNPDSALDTLGLVSPLDARRPEYVRSNGQPYRLSVSCGFTNWFMPRLSTAMLISPVSRCDGVVADTGQICQY